MTDAGFVAAAYAVIIGGLGAYAIWLLRRLSAARRVVERPRDEVR